MSLVTGDSGISEAGLTIWCSMKDWPMKVTEMYSVSFTMNGSEICPSRSGESVRAGEAPGESSRTSSLRMTRWQLRSRKSLPTVKL